MAAAADVEVAEVAAEVTERKTRPFVIQWHITDRCNCRCLHCYQSDYSSQAEYSQLLMMLDAFQEFLAGRDRAGLLTITGGEPLIHPQFWQLLENIKLNCPGIDAAVLSNGTLIDRDAAQRLSALGPRFVQISIEGRQRIHDSIRGQGNYARSIEAIHHLQQAGIRVSVSFTAHAGNYRELKHVARLARKMPRVMVWSDRLIPDSWEPRLKSLDARQTADYLSIMRKTGNTAMNRALQFLEGGHSYRCTAGDSLVAVLPDGTVYPCRRLPISAGNVLEESLEKIYQGDLMTELRSGKCHDCSGCLYQEICNGGLRCLAYASSGEMWKADPGCPIRAGIFRLDKRRWLL